MEFKASEKKYWDSYYSGNNIDYYENRDLYFHRAFKDVMKNLPRGSRILELGCGLRCDGIELAQAGQIVFETDISEVAVAKARQLYDSLSLADHGRFVVCDAEKLPFENNYFDAVFISASFHHLPDLSRALSEMKRVSKAGGYVILGMEPNSWPYYSVFQIMKPLKRLVRKINKKTFSSVADDATHGFSRRKLVELFNQAGLELVSVGRFKYLGEYYDSGWRLAAKIFKKQFKYNRRTQEFLAGIDRFIAVIPLINLTNWHWNIIARKK